MEGISPSRGNQLQK